MLPRYYILEAMLVLVGLGLLVALVKYRRDIFVKLPRTILKDMLEDYLWIDFSRRRDKKGKIKRNKAAES